MAYYGLVSAGVALTATESNDGITNAGALTSTLTAVSVLGLGGDDLINLGQLGTTATALATTQFTGGSTGMPLSARLAGLDAIYTSKFATGTLASGAVVSVTVTGVVTSQNAIRSLHGSQIYGNAGNDTIALGTEVTLFSSTTIGGGAGDDLIGTLTYVNGVSANATVTGAAVYKNSFIEAGGGNDFIYFNGENAFTASTIQGSLGNDTIQLNLSGTNSQITASQILAGGNEDLITGNITTASFSTIAGGGGNDTIRLNLSNTNSLVIAGDTFNSSSEYDGNDLFDVIYADTVSATTIAAGGGNDSIRLSGAGGANAGGYNVFALNAGNDIFSADFAKLTAATIYGGAGLDSIYLASGALTGGTIVFGGGDNDLFNISASGESTNQATIYGGLGADTFSADLFLSGGNNFTIAYSAAADSTISAMDTISIGQAAVNSGTFVFDYDPRGVQLATTSVPASFTATNGIAVFTGTFASDVTSRVQALNSGITNTGGTVLFTNGGTDRLYMFIQGGTDDLVTQIGLVSRGTGTITVANQEIITVVKG